MDIFTKVVLTNLVLVVLSFLLIRILSDGDRKLLIESKSWTASLGLWWIGTLFLCAAWAINAIVAA